MLFAVFSSTEYSLTLFRVHFETFKMLQGSIFPAKSPFFRFFMGFHVPKDSAYEAHLISLKLFAFFLSREYSLTLFRAHFETFKMLQGSIRPAKTPFYYFRDLLCFSCILFYLFIAFFRFFIRFHVHKGSACEAHLPNC